MSGPFLYVTGATELGIGVDNQALAPLPVAPNYSTYGPRYNVRGDFAPLRGAGQFPLTKSVTTTDLRANGVYLSGGLALQALTDFNKANNLG